MLLVYVLIYCLLKTVLKQVDVCCCFICPVSSSLFIFSHDPFCQNWIFMTDYSNVTQCLKCKAQTHCTCLFSQHILRTVSFSDYSSFAVWPSFLSGLLSSRMCINTSCISKELKWQWVYHHQLWTSQKQYFLCILITRHCLILLFMKAYIQHTHM